MMLVLPKIGTMPPGEMVGACAAVAWLIFMTAALIDNAPGPCLAMANLTALIKGPCRVLARNCLAAKTLAIDSGVMSGAPTPILEAERVVAMAMAEPVTAA